MAAALRLVFRSSLRHGWPGLLAIAVLVGVAGGAVLTGAEAFRRTTTAFERMRAATEAWDVLVNPDDGIDSALDAQVVADLPEVSRVGRVDGVLLGPGRMDDLVTLDDQPLTLATDGRAGYDFARYQLLDGRMPSLVAPDEVLLTPTASENLGLEVGDQFDGKVLSFEDFGAIGQEPTVEDAVVRYNDPDTGQRVDLEVVGVGVPIDELVVDEDFSGGMMLVAPPFWDRYGEPSAGFFGLVVELSPGATPDDLRRAIGATVPGETIAFQTADRIGEQVDRAVDPEADAVRVFTLVAALVAAVIVGQATSRRLQLDAVTDPALRALGLTRPQRVGLSLARMAVAGSLGALLAVAIAIVASPVGPVGIIRVAEPDPGIRVDGPVLLVGGVAVLLATVLVSVWPAVRASRAIGQRRRELGIVTSRLVGWGTRPSTVMGARFALEPASASVPARSTLVGAATGVVLVAATVTFAASLDHFVDTPELYGTSWDQIITVDTTTDDEVSDYEPVAAQLDADDRVEAFSVVVPGQVSLDGTSVPAFALADSPRPLRPTVVEGRPPTRDDEVALGRATLDDLGLDVGDTVDATDADGADAQLTVVGRAVLPVIAAYPGSDKTTLGQGAALTSSGLARWSPPFPPIGVATRYAPEVDGADVVADLDVEPTQFLDVSDQGRPSDVASLERIRSTPFLLTTLLVALIGLTVAHALGAAVRARRRELAVLRTFGFSRTQVVGTVATQAALIAVVGLLVGLPTGVAAGRLAWSAVAHGRGAVLSLVTPVLALTLVAAAVLAVAVTVGLVPGVRATRAHPATILRTE